MGIARYAPDESAYQHLCSYTKANEMHTCWPACVADCSYKRDCTKLKFMQHGLSVPSASHALAESSGRLYCNKTTHTAQAWLECKALPLWYGLLSSAKTLLALSETLLELMRSYFFQRPHCTVLLGQRCSCCRGKLECIWQMAQRAPEQDFKI